MHAVNKQKFHVLVDTYDTTQPSDLELNLDGFRQFFHFSVHICLRLCIITTCQPLLVTANLHKLVY